MTCGKRGMVTAEIQAVAKEFLGREINALELRLYPYIDYCLKNGGEYDRWKISSDERDILATLKQAKHLEMWDGSFYASKEFYDFMQTVLWLGYVENKMGVEE